MLRDLSIRNILLIEQLDLSFQSGLNVLTGETGAGKSILLDCLGFVLGWRGRAEIVREGAEKGEVTAEFDLPKGHAAHDVLVEAGLDGGDLLMLRRVTTPDGRKRAFVNDRPCSGDTLRALSSALVELHGQHDDRGLLDAKGHRDLLDAFAELGGLQGRVAQQWEKFSAARLALKKTRAAHEEATKDQEFLIHSAAELDEFSPMAGEDETLDSKRRLMQVSGRIRDDITKAQQAMGPDEGEGRLNDALRWLEVVAEKASGQLDEPMQALERALYELSDAQQQVENVLADMEFDPLELERVEERLFALRALARKYNIQPDFLHRQAEDFRSQVKAVDAGDMAIAALQKEVAGARIDFEKVARELSAARSKAAMRLDAAMAKELGPLKLERAIFSTQVTETDIENAGPTGFNEVAFTVATNPGAPSGPINKIASGGELSRFLLALKVCLTGRSEGLTLIFDEIDRGVGGATADAVGRRLEQVADGSQVVVVTHSPQVAACGQHHWQVSKTVTGEETLTDVKPLDPTARVEEIARMLAGDVITEEARAAAGALLEGRM